MASQSFDSERSFYNPPSAPYEKLWSLSMGGSVISVSTTYNCSLIAAASVDRTISLISFDRKIHWRKRLDHEAWATAISADGSRIAAGTANKNPSSGRIYVYDQAGKELWLHDIGAPVWSISLSADGKILMVGSWNNFIYVFEEKEGDFQKIAESRLGTVGVYGVSLSENGEKCLAAIYENSVLILNRELTILENYPCNTGVYRTMLTSSGNKGVVGLRDGSAMILNCDGTEYHYSFTEKLSERPICGVSITPAGELLALGGFDGRLYVVGPNGQCLWSLTTAGEVWSTSISIDGSLICIGSGDRTLQLIRNICSTSAVGEITTLEKRIQPGLSWQDRSAFANSLVNTYLRYGLIDYGVNKLKEWSGILGDGIFIETTKRLLKTDVEYNPKHGRSHYHLAALHEEAREWRLAAQHYLMAGEAKTLRRSAFIRAGTCFTKLGLISAGMSCFRRASEQYMDDDEKRVLYNLARSYEDTGEIQEAKKHYEILLTWDPAYRDVYSRLEELEKGVIIDGIDVNHEVDYTGLTVSLLGPDIPRPKELDEQLINVISARSKELHVSKEERKKLYNALIWYSTKKRESQDLSYDISSYIKYDYLLPEDELKKGLELINLLALIDDLNPIEKALDIGTATGRHPTILSSRGILTYGIDLEIEAINYASQKRGHSAYPIYAVADGAYIPFHKDTFDLVTCMMGTFSHLNSNDQKKLVSEAYRVLKKNGLFILSTWDIECRHLTYLSMYSHDQKEKIRNNSVTRKEMSVLLESLGFAVAQINSFSLLPDVFSYEFRVQGLGAEAMKRLIEIDLAARGIFPDMHGQMYIVKGKKL